MSGLFGNPSTELKTEKLSSYTGCGACKLHKRARHPKMEPYGLGEKGILLIGDAPSKEEDKKGTPMIGASAKYLEKILKRHGIDLYVDCIKINAYMCTSGAGSEEHDKNPQYVNYCRPSVWAFIQKMKPKLIILLGYNALVSFLGHRWDGKVGTVRRWRGFTIPDRDVNAWVCPTFHPAYVLSSSDKEPMVAKTFLRDIKNAIKLLRKEMPTVLNDAKCIRIIKGKEIYTILKEIATSELSEVAIDFETTGLKPHKEGHKIKTCAIAVSESMCYAFVMPTHPPTLAQLKALLANPAVRKIAANIKYEDTWAAVNLDVIIQGWVWDTMQNAHIIDNREGSDKKESGITGLKFQVYVTFGVVNYDKTVHPFLKSAKKDRDIEGANAINRIDEAPLHDLLMYNGYDSLYELRLAVVQRQVLADY